MGLRRHPGLERLSALSRARPALARLWAQQRLPFGAIGALGGFGKKGFKDGGEIERPVKNGKRNIKHPMHGLGWLKDVR